MLAQSVENVTLNLGVGSSSPTLGGDFTKKKEKRNYRLDVQFSGLSNCLIMVPFSEMKKTERGQVGEEQ